MKILNIHGYHGSAKNTAYRVLEKLYPCQIVSLQFDYDKYAPDNMLSILERLVKEENIGAIVSTSLGGFFACCLSHNREIPVILINPCLLPFITLRQISDSGALPTLCGKQFYELFGKYMGELDNRYLSVIVGKSDEIINHAATTRYLLTIGRYYEIDGGHSFEQTEELEKALLEIFAYYDENLPKIQMGETLWTV